VVTTVDALYGEGQLDAQLESVKQAAVADRIVLTKTDLAAADAVASLRARLRELNPGAPVIVGAEGVAPSMLFDAGIYDPTTKSEDVQRWLRAEAFDRHAEHAPAPDVNRHDTRIRAHCLTYEEPIDWRYFSPNVAALISRHAGRLLRVKGLLNVRGEPAPVAVHGVQHQFRRMRLARWPDADRRSRLVVIARDLTRAELVSWLQAHALADVPADRFTGGELGVPARD